MEIVEEQFPLEREVQRLTEVNLQELFDLVLVESEFELHGLRIDTLAFDKESGGPMLDIVGELKAWEDLILPNDI